MSIGCLEGVWILPGRCLEGVLEVSGGCLSDSGLWLAIVRENQKD